MSIKAVLIDFDGTLANTNDVIIKSFQHVYRTFEGREEDVAVITKAFGEPLRLTLARVFGAEYEEEALGIYRSYQLDRFESLLKEFPGMTDLVKELKKRGYKIGLVTSRIKDSALRGLKALGVLEDFDAITAIDDMTKHKPDPESVFITLERLGIEPENAVMIGDTKFDILCAKNAGCRSVLVDWSVTGPEERDELNADFIAESPEALMKWIIEN